MTFQESLKDTHYPPPAKDINFKTLKRHHLEIPFFGLSNYEKNLKIKDKKEHPKLMRKDQKESCELIEERI